MGLRWLGGLALCVSLVGCVRLSPAFGDDGTEGGAEGGETGQSSMTSGADSSDPTGNSGTSQGPTVGPESDSNDVDSHGSSAGSTETTDATSDSTGEVDCMPEAKCGPGQDPCPKGFVCNAYVDPDTDNLTGGCFEVGTAERGEICEAACGADVERCAEGLACTSWRDTAICLDRCATSNQCDGDLCESPNGLAGFVGACVVPAPCDLLDPQSCDAGVCVPSMDQQTAHCVPSGGNGMEGDPCSSVNACAPTLHCSPAEVCPGKDACCLPMCDLGAKKPVCACDGLEVEDQPDVGICVGPVE